MPGVFEASGAEGAAYLLIWTTTPWTLPANTAVSLAPDADYVHGAPSAADTCIMAKELVEHGGRGGRLGRLRLRAAVPTASR